MRKYRPIIILFVLLAASYSAEMILIPTEHRTLRFYEISAHTERIINEIMLVPILSIWSAVLFAFIRFRHYAQTISNSKDGKPLLTIANGLFFLALWLPITGVINNSITYLYHVRPDIIGQVVIAKNYFNIALLLIVFCTIWHGSRKLANTTKSRKPYVALGTGYRAVFVLVSIAYITLIAYDPYKTVPPAAGIAAFYVSGWLLAVTIFIPYGFIWFMGLSSIRNLELYRQNIKGIIYKDALRYLSSGLIVTIVALLANRFINVLASWFNGLAMMYVLTILYGLLGVIGIGSLFIIQGVKRLQQIEEA